MDLYLHDHFVAFEGRQCFSFHWIIVDVEGINIFEMDIL